MSTAEAEPTTVIGLDIEDYSGRDRAGQHDLREGLAAAFGEAAANVGLVVAPADRQEHGDGELLLVRGGVSLARIVADLPRELAIPLALRNRTRTPDGHLRVRMVVHHGMVQVGRFAWHGDDLVATARILNCQAGRELLRADRDATLLLLLSQQAYGYTVAERDRGLDPADFVSFRLGGQEKGAGLTAWATLWMRRAGEGTGHPAARRPPAVPPANSTGGSRTVMNNHGAAALGDRSAAIGRDHYGNISLG